MRVCGVGEREVGRKIAGRGRVGDLEDFGEHQLDRWKKQSMVSYKTNKRNTLQKRKCLQSMNRVMLTHVPSLFIMLCDASWVHYKQTFVT